MFKNISKRGFTLIELLVVIAIIAILAAILFPVFAKVREKARQITCTSNLKQFELSILEYANDNDEALPLAWNIQACIGTKAGALTGQAPRGTWNDIMPYVKSTQVFECPDDKGVTIDINGAGGGNTYAPLLNLDGTKQKIKKVPLGLSAFDVFGMAYKFTKENFTYISGKNGQAAFNCATPGTSECLVPATPGVPTVWVAGAQQPPNPMTLGYFSQPAGTRMIRDFNAPNDTEKWDTTQWHDTGYNIGFADGHVKFILKQAIIGKDFQCDGPTLSQNHDGSCNSAGLERTP